MRWQVSVKPGAWETNPKALHVQGHPGPHSEVLTQRRERDRNIPILLDLRSCELLKKNSLEVLRSQVVCSPT